MDSFSFNTPSPAMHTILFEHCDNYWDEIHSSMTYDRRVNSPTNLFLHEKTVMAVTVGVSADCI